MDEWYGIALTTTEVQDAWLDGAGDALPVQPLRCVRRLLKPKDRLNHRLPSTAAGKSVIFSPAGSRVCAVYSRALSKAELIAQSPAT